MGEDEVDGLCVWKIQLTRWMAQSWREGRGGIQGGIQGGTFAAGWGGWHSLSLRPWE